MCRMTGETSISYRLVPVLPDKGLLVVAGETEIIADLLQKMGRVGRMGIMA